jgi:amino acid transporter
MATVVFYISFVLPVLGATWTRLKGRWEPGPFNLGRWGMLVAMAASFWAVFEYFNIAWPRAEGVPWYQDWAVFLMSGIVLALGILAYMTVRTKVLAAEDRLEADPTAVHWSEEKAEPRSPA